MIRMKSAKKIHFGRVELEKPFENQGKEATAVIYSVRRQAFPDGERWR